MFATVDYEIGITAHFIGTFAATGLQDKLAEKEYKKLKNKQK